MAKAVLVMDIPEDCTMCKFWNSKDDECYATGVEELSLNSEEAKPDWCPLRELPERMEVCRPAIKTSLLHNKNGISTGKNGADRGI